MNADSIFQLIITIIILNFILEQWLGWLNDKESSEILPDTLKGIYNPEKYSKQRAYDKEKRRLSLISSSFSFVLILLMLFFNGFSYVDLLAKRVSVDKFILPLFFFGILVIASDILAIPFSIYSTFVIEERFGFNRTTLKTYVLDKFKGAIFATIIGGGLLVLFIGFYEFTGQYFWLWTWLIVSIFMILITMFYASVIVPIFNKLTPLVDGDLKNEIFEYCNKVGFRLDNLFVMNGSKRSSKANAFFSGLGSKKRIVLYDTLVNIYSKEEITAVLAHEIGHYKKKHTLTTILVALLQAGLMLFVLSLVIDNPNFSSALGVQEKSFHVNLLVFSFLYAPLSMLIGVVINIISRRNEFEADNFAKETYKADPLISSLKKLSVDSLSNLTPHPYYVFVNYSHPTLLQRIKALSQ